MSKSVVEQSPSNRRKALPEGSPVIHPKLYRQITHAHKEATPKLTAFKAERKSVKNSDFSQRRDFMTSGRVSEFFSKRSQGAKSLFSKTGVSFLPPATQQLSLNRTNVLPFAKQRVEQTQAFRKAKMHPQKVILTNLDVEYTLTDDVVSKLYEARCIDMHVPPNQAQRQSFLSYCREKCIAGRLVFPDMAFGYKCAEFICSLLMDSDYYISYMVSPPR